MTEASDNSYEPLSPSREASRPPCKTCKGVFPYPFRCESVDRFLQSYSVLGGPSFAPAREGEGRGLFSYLKSDERLQADSQKAWDMSPAVWGTPQTAWLMLEKSKGPELAKVA